MDRKILIIIWLLLAIFFQGFAQETLQVKPETSIAWPSYDKLEGRYDSFRRESKYITMRDGVRLAIDIYRPTKNGTIENCPLPVIWNHTRYTRALKGLGGNIQTLVSSPLGMMFIKQGYILVVADARGTGASFGIKNGLFAQESAKDAYEIIEWIASQKWCNGNVGMMGGSYEGVTQLMAASTKPPHLKAIFPAMCLFDLYDFPYHNGVLFDDCLVSVEETLNKSIKRNVGFIAPIDEDSSRVLLQEAVSFRKNNRSIDHIFPNLPYRDSFDSLTHSSPYQKWGPSNYIDKINESGVAIYVYGGWFDLFSRDALVLYDNLTVPKKLSMVDSPHSSVNNPGLTQFYFTEQLRWFDYWLKSIPNGIMEEPPVTIQQMGMGGAGEFLSSEKWPLKNTFNMKLYFLKGPSGTVGSLNDDILDKQKPDSGSGTDKYQADLFYKLKTGHQVRLNLVCADRDNTNSHKIFTVPEITLWRNSQYPSNLELPLVINQLLLNFNDRI